MFRQQIKTRLRAVEHIGRLKVPFQKFFRNSKGATAIEYGLIAALVAIAAITAMRGLGGKVSTTLNNASASLK
jgi:pilus assembly protein Flp/PilA